MDLGDFETSHKVIVIGDAEVGKTSLVNRFCRGTFSKDYNKTIGAEFKNRIKLTLDQLTTKTIKRYLKECIHEKNLFGDTGEETNFMIWDTCGGQSFSSINSKNYKGAAAAIILFSTVDRNSFLHVPEWHKKAREASGTNIKFVLVQNKCDLLDEAAFSNEEVEQVARDLKTKLYRTCCKDNVNVLPIFEYIAKICASSSPGSSLVDIGDITASIITDTQNAKKVITPETDNNNTEKAVCKSPQNVVPSDTVIPEKAIPARKTNQPSKVRATKKKSCTLS